MTGLQGCQGVHALRDRLAESINLAADNIRVIAPDVGGAFGLKFFLQCETVVAAHAAMDISRPVKWIGERNESFLSDLHGRDHVSRAELAIDEAGKFTAHARFHNSQSWRLLFAGWADYSLGSVLA